MVVSAACHLDPANKFDVSRRKWQRSTTGRAHQMLREPRDPKCDSLAQMLDLRVLKKKTLAANRNDDTKELHPRDYVVLCVAFWRICRRSLGFPLHTFCSLQYLLVSVQIEEPSLQDGARTQAQHLIFFRLDTILQGMSAWRPAYSPIRTMEVSQCSFRRCKGTFRGARCLAPFHSVWLMLSFRYLVRNNIVSCSKAELCV